MHRIVSTFALSGCLALAACGGGGGDSKSTSGGFSPDESGKDNSGTTANTSSYPVSAAFASFFAKESTYQLSADVNGTTFTLTHSYAPRTEAVEPGLSSSPLKSFRIDETLAVDGTTDFAGAAIVYFSPQPFQLWGDREVVAPEGELEGTPYQFAQAVSRTPAPESAKIGASQELGKWSYSYLDENNVERQQTTTVSWSLEDAGNANAWLCLLQKEDDEEGGYVHKSCSQIDREGASVDYKVDFIFPTGTINFRQNRG